MGRAPAANDINPLSAMLSGPRLDPPPLAAVADRLAGTRPGARRSTDPAEADLLAFYHPDTLRQITRTARMAAGEPASSILSMPGSGWWRSTG